MKYAMRQTAVTPAAEMAAMEKVANPHSLAVEVLTTPQTQQNNEIAAKAALPMVISKAKESAARISALPPKIMKHPMIPGIAKASAGVKDFMALVEL